MVDLHTHIIFNVDDGSRNLEETLSLIKEASEVGITDLVMTPHYIKDSIYQFERDHLLSKLKEIKKEVKKLKIKINLYLGNEIYLDDDATNLIKEKKFSTINDSKYILIEFPMFGFPNNIRDVIFNLKLANYIPIIAHPERYTYFESLEYVREIKDQGALFQGNLGSLIGKYGPSAQKSLKAMLKADMIDVMASDVHRFNTIYTELPKTLKKLNKIIGSKKVKLLTEQNPMYIIDNLNLDD